MVKNKTILIFLCTTVLAVVVNAQDLVADNMLLFQRSYGGWPKHFYNKKIDYNKVYSNQQKEIVQNENNKNDATIDNGATTTEIRYLLNTYKKTAQVKYLLAAEQGVEYLLKAQYANGGWPQFYPDLSSYKHYITYNDNAIVNVLHLFLDIVNGANNTGVLTNKYKTQVLKAVERGVNCILKTQIKVNGVPTVWCQQHDEHNYKPVGARTFELPGFTAHESAYIVEFLMRIEKPNKKIIAAVNNAVKWLQQHTLYDIDCIIITTDSLNDVKDRVVVQKPNNQIWARFYDIETQQPFFAGRDGIKKFQLSEIELERRMGYGWYGYWPKDIITKKYKDWCTKNKIAVA